MATGTSLKRPHEIEVIQNDHSESNSPMQNKDQDNASNTAAISPDVEQLSDLDQIASASRHTSVKRHCNDLNSQSFASEGNNIKPIEPNEQISSLSGSKPEASIFNASPTLLAPLGEHVASYLDEKLKETNRKKESENEAPIFSIAQTQTICESIIREREEKLRDEYGRILHKQLTEQYDMFLKASYLNSLETRFPPPPPTPPSLAVTNQAFSALANVFSTIQRNSASAAAAAAASSVSSSVAIQDLSNFASASAALNQSGNIGHATRHSPMSLNFQQQAAALQAHRAQQQQSRSLTNLVPSNTSTSPVLLVSSIDEQLSNPDALFKLFGVFGDVIRVKILFNKKDNALVQMADANQAHVAQNYLDKQRVFGKCIRVTRSKYQIVQMPRDQSDAGLTKDFTNSPLHRFKIPGSRNYLNIYPPSNTLHISNIPATISEVELCKAFETACKFKCSSFKFFPKDRKMALMKFDSIENATIALIKMHNYQISDENHLRVSFSKSLTLQ